MERAESPTFKSERPRRPLAGPRCYLAVRSRFLGGCKHAIVKYGIFNISKWARAATESERNVILLPAAPRTAPDPAFMSTGRIHIAHTPVRAPADPQDPQSWSACRLQLSQGFSASNVSSALAPADAARNASAAAAVGFFLFQTWTSAGNGLAPVSAVVLEGLVWPPSLHDTRPLPSAVAVIRRHETRIRYACIEALTDCYSSPNAGQKHIRVNFRHLRCPALEERRLAGPRARGWAADCPPMMATPPRCCPSTFVEDVPDPRPTVIWIRSLRGDDPFSPRQEARIRSSRWHQFRRGSPRHDPRWHSRRVPQG